MSKQYDFSKQTNYLDRKMFLDGAVTIQRFEEVAFPKIQSYEETQLSFFWRPQEVSLVKCQKDYKVSTEAIQFVYTSNLLRQTALDSIQGKAPAQIFTPVVSVPEMELLMTAWSFFEGNIHSKSYSHIIRNIYNMPKDQFNTIHDTKEIVEMAAGVGKYYDHLHYLNSVIETGGMVSEKTHIKAIWLALHASYALEAIRFLVSFATSLAMVENKIFIGSGNIISLILQDELLHTEWTAYIIKEVLKHDERFREIEAECRDEVYQMYMDVIREEKSWTRYIMSHGVIIGLNTEILDSFVDHRAFVCLKEIGIKYAGPKINPLPWFSKHANTSKKQAALQETESTSYVLGAMTSDIDLSQLPDI